MLLLISIILLKRNYIFPLLLAGQPDQRASDDRDRRLDQLALQRLRHHQSPVSLDAQIQAHVAKRHRVDVLGRQLGQFGFVVFP